MKYTRETEIDAPIDELSELVGDPTNWPKWMDGLEQFEHVSGSPGMPDAEYRLAFETGGTTIEMQGTVVERDLPEKFLLTMVAPHVVVTITTRLVASSPRTTTHVSEQEFEFDSVKDKIIGQFLRWEFKKQTRRHVENFKQLAEA